MKPTNQCTGSVPNWPGSGSVIQIYRYGSEIKIYVYGPLVFYQRFEEISEKKLNSAHFDKDLNVLAKEMS
jgi:hypothetical protein